MRGDGVVEDDDDDEDDDDFPLREGSSPGRIAPPDGKSAPSQVPPRDGGASSRKLPSDFIQDKTHHIEEDGH